MPKGTWGGKREGSGRPPKGEFPGVPHLTRAPLAPRFPVHVTWKVKPEVSLRSRRSFAVLAQAVDAGAERFGFRVVHYAVIGSELQLIVEAPDRRALTRGLQGLGVRIARATNRLLERVGSIFADRYQADILKTAADVERARQYLQTNAYQHDRDSADPAETPVIAPRTQLLLRSS